MQSSFFLVVLFICCAAVNEDVAENGYFGKWEAYLGVSFWPFVAAMLAKEFEGGTTYMKLEEAADTQIRLVGSSDPSKGRLEIFKDGKWGTVCADKFDQTDATVICKMLGYNYGNQTKEFGQGDGNLPIHLDDVDCTGLETDILDCPYAQTPNCDHTEDIGVKCYGGDGKGTTKPPATTTKVPIVILPDNCKTNSKPDNLRLRGPRDQEGIGIVEVKNSDGDWGTVCDDNANIKLAQVVCRMLCYNPKESMPGAPASGLTGLVLQVPITLDNVRCNGTESSIFDCQHSLWGNHNCEDTEFATVTCKPYAPEDLKAPSPELICGSSVMNVSFSTDRDRFLQPEHIKVFDTGDLSKVTCKAETTEANKKVTITIPYDECNTVLTTNATHLIFSNIVHYDYTVKEGIILRVNTYQVHVSCELPRGHIVDDNVIPQSLVVTKSAEGAFVVNMRFYNDSLFTHEVKAPVYLALGQFLYVEITLSNAISNLKVVARNCIATPTPNADDLTNYPLFKDSCKEDSTVGFYPINRTHFGFGFQTFKFQSQQDFYLHCDAYVCKESEKDGFCERSCVKNTTGNRRKRSISAISAYYVQLSSERFTVYDPRIIDNEVVIETISNGSLVTKVKTKNTTPVPKVKPSTPGFKTTHSTTTSGEGRVSLVKEKEAGSTTQIPRVIDKTTSIGGGSIDLDKEIDKLVKEELNSVDGDGVASIMDGMGSSASCCKSRGPVWIVCLFWLTISVSKAIVSL